MFLLHDFPGPPSKYSFTNERSWFGDGWRPMGFRRHFKFWRFSQYKIKLKPKSYLKLNWDLFEKKEVFLVLDKC